MGIIYALPLLAQATFMPPPAPPAAAAPGTAIFQRQQQQLENQLRQSCLSEDGIRIAMEHWARLQDRTTERVKLSDQLQRDIATAAYATPVDLQALEAALTAQAEAQIAQEQIRLEDAIQLLRRLSPEDRAIYARRHTWMQPTTPAPVCNH